MAAGMLTKQATFNTAKFLNDVNDANAGGVIVSLPAGAPSPAVSQDIPGDRIVLFGTASPHREAPSAACRFLMTGWNTPFWQKPRDAVR